MQDEFPCGFLIVEDEPKTADYLYQGLSESGYVVDAAHTGVDGLHLARQHQYDLVILDVNLPQIDGFGVLGQLRQDTATRVLMLSARGRLADKVKGLDLGADDYLVKPFEFPELLARVRSLLRRAEQIAVPEVLRVADLELDPGRHRAFRGSQRIDLTTKGIRPAAPADAPRRRGAVAHPDHLAGVGHELRLRHQRGGGLHPPLAGEDRRPVREQTYPHPARRRLRAGRPRMKRPACPSGWGGGRRDGRRTGGGAGPAGRLWLDGALDARAREALESKLKQIEHSLALDLGNSLAPTWWATRSRVTTT